MNENDTKDLSTGATPVVEGVEVVTLDYPIKRGDTEVKEITLRKPMAGQLRGVKLTELLSLDVGAVQMILPRITTPTLLPHEIAQLDPADITELGTKVAGFFVRKSIRAEYLTA
ncbi:phage tail assembly protein [Comamonas testosteroni]|uniref:phage tail assembly protein n=1 Tax=Comamonas testosteroni TaxID=285 RepID=UPI000680D7D4|nr:phage tail assembly protein [Comamonas testosteroni]